MTDREYVYHCKRCLVCKASLYPELLPPIEAPASLTDAGKWLSRVRALARKSVILSKEGARPLNVLIHVPVDEETFAWSLENEYVVVYRYPVYIFTYQLRLMRRFAAVYSSAPLASQPLKDEDFEYVHSWVEELSFVHEACFTILAESMKRPEMRLEEACSMEDVMSLESLKASTGDVWPVELHIYPDYDLTPILTLDEFWKFQEPASSEEPDPSSPSVQNRLRIIDRIERIIAKEIRNNQKRHIAARSQIPEYIQKSYTIGLPQNFDHGVLLSQLCFGEPGVDTSVVCKAYTNDFDGSLTGLQLLYASGLVQTMGMITEILQIESSFRPGNITGISISIRKESYQRLGLPSVAYENIRGIKLEMGDGSIFPTLGKWDGLFVRVLKPGKGSHITGLKWQPNPLGLSNVMLLESNLSSIPQSSTDVNSIRSTIPPLNRLCWPAIISLLHHDITTQKSIGMDLPHHGTSFAGLITISSTDALAEIEICTSRYNKLRFINFTTVSKQTQNLSLDNYAHPPYSWPSRAVSPIIRTTTLKLAAGEHLSAIEVRYELPFSPPCSTSRTDPNVADEELIDLIFHTTLCRTSVSINPDRKPSGSEEFEFMLRAPEGEEISGVYVDDPDEKMAFGLLTRPRVV